MTDTVRSLLHAAGTTYAGQAGIRLADRPAPLYQLLVVSVLLATRIKADLAVAAARELFAAGCGTPRGMLQATWQDRVDALGRAHYVRYDESTATALGEGARLLQERWHGDLRRLRAEAGGEVPRLERLLQEFPRLGPTGAAIFCREVQEVWPQLRPYLDAKTLAGARRLHLPADPDRLAGLVGEAELTRLAAGLVRVSLDAKLAQQVANAE